MGEGRVAPLEGGGRGRGAYRVGGEDAVDGNGAVCVHELDAAALAQLLSPFVRTGHDGIPELEAQEVVGPCWLHTAVHHEDEPAVPCTTVAAASMVVWI